MKNLALVLLFLSGILCFAQNVDDKLTKAVVGEMEEIAMEVIQQSFSPVCQLEANRYSATFTPGVFRIDNLNTPVDLDKVDLWGTSIGLGGAYGLAPRWLVYAIYSGLFIRGEVEAPLMIGQQMNYQVSLDYHGLFAGVGYEILSEENLSIPVYLGFQGQGYFHSMESQPHSVGPVSYSLNNSGKGMLWGISGGAAVKWRFGTFEFSPYYLHMFNFNGAEVKTEASSSALPSPAKYSHELNPFQGGTLGVDLGFQTDKNWTFGASLVNLLPFLRSSFDDDSFTSFVGYVRYQPY